MANISAIKVGNTSYGITATPTAHASTATTYGAASASNYGHVKLSDNYTSSAGTAASGIGASSAAVYHAYNTLNSNLKTKLYSRTFSVSKNSSIVVIQKVISIVLIFYTVTGGPKYSSMSYLSYWGGGMVSCDALAATSTDEYFPKIKGANGSYTLTAPFQGVFTCLCGEDIEIIKTY